MLSAGKDLAAVLQALDGSEGMLERWRQQRVEGRSGKARQGSVAELPLIKRMLKYIVAAL